MSSKQQRQELDELRQDLDALRAGHGDEVRRVGIIEDRDWFGPGKRPPGTSQLPRIRLVSPGDWYDTPASEPAK